MTLNEMNLIWIWIENEFHVIEIEWKWRVNIQEGSIFLCVNVLIKSLIE